MFRGRIKGLNCLYLCSGRNYHDGKAKEFTKTAGLYPGIYVQDHINGCVQLQPPRWRELLACVCE